MVTDLQRTYENRFAKIEAERELVWQILTRHYFQRWISPTDSVLDVGAGYCEFINHIEAANKYALDLNPVTAVRARDGVTVISQDVLKEWPLASRSINVVFTSNFFEHLPAKNDLLYCLREIRRVLVPGGIMIAMGPNIRYCYNVYWDFFDHHLPLSDRSLAEALELEGFREIKTIPRFLPYTMKEGAPRNALLLVRLYLMLPLLWPLFGKQFLIVARKDR